MTRGFQTQELYNFVILNVVVNNIELDRSLSGAEICRKKFGNAGNERVVNFQ
jgi:hypothetical protein